jgi:hypothetical protein
LQSVVAKREIFHKSWVAKASGKEPESCLGQVLHVKLGSFSVLKEVHGANMSKVENSALGSSCRIVLVHSIKLGFHQKSVANFI